MGAGNRQRIAHAQRAELGAGQVGVDVVDLVGHQEGALVALAQVLANHLVGGAQTGTRIDHEQHGIGFFDGLQGLLGHLRVDAVFVTGNTTGVDHDISAPLPLGLAILAITRQPREIADDGIPSSGQAVEQCGLAHVGAAHQGDYRNHWLLQGEN